MISIFFARFKFFGETADTSSIVENITCSDFESLPLLGPLLLLTSSFIKLKSDVNFLVSTLENKDPVDIDESDWSGLKNISFSPSKRTYIIIHGYYGSSEDSWILGLKDKLLNRVSCFEL